MNSKFLTVLAAVVLFSGAAFAQDNSTTPPPSDPAAASSTAAPDASAPAPAPAAPEVKAPSPTAAPTDNPYGLMDIIHKGNPVSLGVLILLGIMSVGSWYIFFVKYFEQGRILGQARTVERRFWSSGTLNEGIDKLPKNSMFRLIAESGVRASQGGTSLVGLNDWIAMSLTRQLDDANARLQGGIAFLASVGSTAPFVGLFGTVWGILQALIAIGVAGQMSIDKVAGPVGEALIMTAIGLFVAVPAVLCYNFLVRRNKVIQEKLRGFAGDLQTYLISKSK
ncbi:MAG TPA: MotA/TolQ/ExbB proton channel family protein [Rhizomicrobium sp.]|jgi:biopolymer transport protein ExbB|nr:MotA/TolQ/ExbB proton channel family protein [Rhizomicrobium sp.]